MLENLFGGVRLGRVHAPALVQMRECVAGSASSGRQQNPAIRGEEGISQVAMVQKAKRLRPKSIVFDAVGDGQRGSSVLRLNAAMQNNVFTELFRLGNVS